MFNAQPDFSFVIAHLIGGIAFIMGILGYAQHNERKVRLFMGLQGILASIHFFLLGHYSGSFSAGISGCRNWISIYNKTSVLAMPFIIFYITFGLWGFHKWFDLLPICASVLSTYNYFFLTGTIFRINLIATSTLWLIHNVLAFSWALAVMELLMIISASHALYTTVKFNKENI